MAEFSFIFGNDNRKKIMTIIEELGGTADFDKILEWANKNRYRDMAKDSAMVSIFANLSESSLEWAIPALVKKGLIELKITEKGKKSIKLNGDFK